MKRCLVCCIVAIVSVSPIRADDLDQFRQREQILAQKWRGEVAAALDVANRQARNDPAGARETLQGALDAVKNAPLNDGLRNELTRQLTTRLGQVAQAPAAPLGQSRPVTLPRANGPQPAAGSPSYTNPPPPATGPASAAQRFIQNNNAALSKSVAERDKGASNLSGVMGSIQNSAIPVDGDVAFSKNHKQIADRRAPVVNSKEEAVMKALTTAIDGDFSGMNFRQALDSIMQKSGLTIIPDAQSLRDANVDYDDPVNFKIPAKISVRTALRKILGDRGLSYTINEGTVNVVTMARAREATVVRIYPVVDLVTPVQTQPQYVIGPFGGLVPVAPNTFPPGTPGVVPSFQAQMGQTIADMVRTSVDPNYWAPNGPGTVMFNEATGTLVVRASAEVHFMINGALGRR